MKNVLLVKKIDCVNNKIRLQGDILNRIFKHNYEIMGHIELYFKNYTQLKQYIRKYRRKIEIPEGME